MATWQNREVKVVIHVCSVKKIDWIDKNNSYFPLFHLCLVRSKVKSSSVARLHLPE